MDYGYARCSTNESKQDIDRQRRELKAMGIKEENIFWEYESGTNTSREKLSRLLEIVSSGDVIVALEVSRITRSTKHLCEIMEVVQDKKLKLIIGSFVVDCTKDEIDPMTEGMLMMWGVFAEMERKIIVQRVRSGIANARAKGKVLGRPQVTADTVPGIFLKYYPRFKSGNINLSELAKLCEMSRTSIYKYLKLVENSNYYKSITNSLR